MEVFNIFGNTGKFLAGIRDHCLKRNASAETIKDPSYKKILFNKKSVVAVIAQINSMNNQGSIFLRKYAFFAYCYTNDRVSTTSNKN